MLMVSEYVFLIPVCPPGTRRDKKQPSHCVGKDSLQISFLLNVSSSLNVITNQRFTMKLIRSEIYILQVGLPENVLEISR